MLTIETPNMFLDLPVPTVELGPAWAIELNAAFNVVDQHDHSLGRGVSITPDGLDMSSDLSFNNTSNITDVRSCRFYSSLAVLSGIDDVGCLYIVDNELYYNDVTGGHRFPLTNNGNVSGAAGTITGLPSGTASASYDSIPGTFVFEQSTNTAANMDIATLILRYPGSYPSPTGNFIALQAPSSLSTGYAYTLPPDLPSETNAFLVSSTGGDLSYVNIDSDSLTITSHVLAVRRNVVVSHTNTDTALAIVRGFFDGSGSIVTGEGFTVTRTGTGRYEIAWTIFFEDIPAVTASVSNIPGGPVTPNIASPGISGVTIATYDTSIALIDSGVHFIAIGKRA